MAEIHTRSKGSFPGAMKPVDKEKKDVHPLKALAPKVPVDKGRPSGQSKNTLVENHPEKENTAPLQQRRLQMVNSHLRTVKLVCLLCPILFIALIIILWMILRNLGPISHTLIC